MIAPLEYQPAWRLMAVLIATRRHLAKRETYWHWRATLAQQTPHERAQTIKRAREFGLLRHSHGYGGNPIYSTHAPMNTKVASAHFHTDLQALEEATEQMGSVQAIQYLDSLITASDPLKLPAIRHLRDRIQEQLNQWARATTRS